MSTIAIDNEIKKKAQVRAKKENVSLTLVIQNFLSDYADGFTQMSPNLAKDNFPNEETRKVLDETDKGEDFNYAKNSSELFNELGI